ncbi:hypothetical protein [Kitasatospora sp. NPDC058218]|uniref:hypothetical protein n=1 Tax=Kitasatospora sp. NPDC058218 TaxID=3346385 RepID=UPI0036DAEC7F
MTPGFTAARTLDAARGRYWSKAGAGAGGGRKAAVTAQSSSVSGADARTFCLGGVLSVVSVDRDENGNVVNWHIIDEVGSC